MPHPPTYPQPQHDVGCPQLSPRIWLSSGLRPEPGPSTSRRHPEIQLNGFDVDDLVDGTLGFSARRVYRCDQDGMSQPNHCGIRYGSASNA